MKPTEQPDWTRMWARAWVAALLGITLVLFGWTLRQRAPLFDNLHSAVDVADRNTARLVLCTRHWWREGIGRLWFAMYMEPLSIEHPTSESRATYVSFPPGSLVPVFLLAKATGHEPTMPLAMGYSLFNQFCIAFLLSLLSLVVLRQMGYPREGAAVLSMAPAILYLWLPSPYLEHHLGSFSDQAVQLPFVLYVLLEALRWPVVQPSGCLPGQAEACTTSGIRRALSLAQGAVAFWGMQTDWLFAPVVFCLYLTRAARGGLGRTPKAFLLRSAVFSLPVVMALGLFALQLYHLDAFGDLFDRFEQRSAVDTRPGLKAFMSGGGERSLKTFFSLSLNDLFWRGFVPMGYGVLGRPLIFSCTVALLGLLASVLVQRVRRKPLAPALTRPTAVSFLTLAPCLLYYHVLRNHHVCVLHFFTTLKFAIPLALMPFVLLPAALLCACRPGTERRLRLWRAAALVAPALLVVLAGSYVYGLEGRREALLMREPMDYVTVGTFLDANTGYDDVVFSEVQDISVGSPTYLAYSMKLVHHVNTIYDIAEQLKPIQGEYVVNLFSRGPDHFREGTGLGALAERAYAHIEENDLHLRKIRKSDFLEVWRDPKTSGGAPPASPPR